DDESSTTLTVNTRSFVGSVIVTVPPRGRASSASSDTSCAQSENPPGVSVTSSRWTFAAISSLPLLGGHRQRHRHRSDIHLLPPVDVGVIFDDIAAAARFGHRPVDARVPLRVPPTEMPGAAAGAGIGWSRRVSP